MKILHIGNPAKVAMILSRTQRKQGDESDVLMVYPDKHSFGFDRQVLLTGMSRTSFLNTFEVARIAERYDIIHLHGGLTWNRLDALMIKYLKRKRIVLHYHGTDLVSGKGRRYRHIASKRLVARPDLLKLMSGTVYVPNPFDVEDWPMAEAIPRKEPVILHMPTNRLKKGTAQIITAMNEIKGVDFRIVENVPWQKAMETIYEADIVLDDVVSGVINMLGFQAMAVGKILVTKFDENARHYPGAPVIWKGDIQASVLSAIDKWKDHRSLYASCGREYVKRNHDPDKIARVHKFYYEQALDLRE